MSTPTVQKTEVASVGASHSTCRPGERWRRPSLRCVVVVTPQPDVGDAPPRGCVRNMRGARRQPTGAPSGTHRHWRADDCCGSARAFEGSGARSWAARFLVRRRAAQSALHRSGRRSALQSEIIEAYSRGLLRSCGGLALAGLRDRRIGGREDGIEVGRGGWPEIQTGQLMWGS